ncbi:MAG: hypothetical protein LDL25_07645 [Hyphomicrobiales bacterium]|jgi:hypothetical protein|uniref:Ig-like domain-containing protein n=1 Tax=Rhabdaerophilum calidifontis TaxID=2604328 RepID=UPI00123AF71E|nr:Ig-like domain-containing protein [Rhabdaerophilum calidifontis]MCA1952994.1 hypothetical protein [Hyphomicrobiales bacterium]MCA1999647.1 hypothetical protein [Hyphomicrobiales bacterium]
MILRQIACLACFLLAGAEARAGCSILPGTFSFGRNAETTATADAEGCFHSYTANDVTAFTGATIAIAPRNGTLVPQGGMTFQYTPKPGFRGQDRYGIRVCGVANNRPGCSTITYQVTVE